MPPIILVGARVGWDLVRHPVRVADSGRFNLDDVRTEIRQDRRSTRTRQETGEIDNFQARKNIVRSHSSPSNPFVNAPGTVELVFRETRTCLPSCLLSTCKSRRATIQGEGLRSGWSPILC